MTGLPGVPLPGANGNDEPQLPIRWLKLMCVTLPLIILSTGWIANSEMKTAVTEITISSLFMGVTFILFVVTLLNLLVRRYCRDHWALTQLEMMALYTMLSMASAVAGVGNYGFFLPFLANPFYYNTASNGWRGWWPLLPDFIGPRSKAVLKPFYLGHSSFLQPGILQAWARPLIIWSLFFLMLIWTTLCLASMLRRGWESEEYLPFPVIALPLEMTRPGAPLYSNRLLWLGFAIPALLHSINSLHSIYPTLPFFPVNSVHDAIPDFGLSTPWTGMGSFFYMLHPAGVGFGYLINTDVSFSLWFFYLLKKLVLVWAVTMNFRNAATGWGVEANGQFPYISAQGWGAWVGLAVMVLWSGRRHLKGYIYRAIHGDAAGIDADEPMSARLGFFGFVLGFLSLCTFVWVLGGSWWLPPLFFGIYVLIVITLSRIRAETAVLSSELVWVTPQSMIPGLLGTNHMSHTDMVHMATLSWFNTDYRAVPMPHMLEGFVGQHRSRGRMSSLVWAIMFAAAVAMVAALLWDLQLYYSLGAATAKVNAWRILKGSEPWNNLQHWIQDPTPPNFSMAIAMVFGGVVTAILTVLRMRFVDFPLNAAGYAFNMTFANDFFWCDMLVAWLLKSLIMRYGGRELYRKCLPFFLGLILGDFVTGSVWSIIGTVLHLNLFRTFST